MTPGAKRTIRLLLSAAIIVLLVLFARTVDWADAWTRLRSAELGPLLAAIVVNLLSLGLKGLRWWIFIRPIAPCSLGLTLRATFAGAGLNNVLVANGGEAARVVFVARATGAKTSRVLATLALERMFEALGYVVLLVAAAFILPLPSAVTRWRVPGAVLLVLALGLLVFLVRRPRKAVDVSSPKPASMLGRARRVGGRFLSTLSDVATGPRFVGAFLISMAIWACQIVVYHLTARAAHFPIPLAGTVAALLAVNIGFMVRATPGNVGVFQVIYAVIATSLGLNKDAAVAAALLIQTIQILPVTLLGVALAPEFVLRNRHVGEQLKVQAEAEVAGLAPEPAPVGAPALVTERRRVPRERR